MTTAIVPAAGTSSRMGKQNKLLLPFRKKTIIETVIHQLEQSRVDEIIVVLGYEADKIQQLLANVNVRFTTNDDYLSGMTSSIQAGIRVGNKHTDGYLICLSDMPFLTSADYDQMIDAVSGVKEILVPYYANRKGNPVFFSSHFGQEILNHQEPEGCRGVVQDNRQFIRKIPFDNKHILMDIDTIVDFRNLRG